MTVGTAGSDGLVPETWNTRKSSLSHHVGPSSSYGSASSTSATVALPDTALMLAVNVTVVGAPENALVSGNCAAQTQVKRCGVFGGSETSSAMSEVATTETPPSEEAKVGAWDGLPLRSAAMIPS